LNIIPGREKNVRDFSFSKPPPPWWGRMKERGVKEILRENRTVPNSLKAPH